MFSLVNIDQRLDSHTEIASFLASFTKVCSMFASNRIPPQVNYQTPNPAIHWDEYNMRVPVEVEEFKTRNTSGKKLVSMYVILSWIRTPLIYFVQQCVGPLRC
jgi:hypothetical protein